MSSTPFTPPLILLVFANDSARFLSEIQQEQEQLQGLLKPVVEQLQYELKVLEDSSVETLIEQLDNNSGRLILLHFAGHSNSEVLQLDSGVAHQAGLAGKLQACRHLQLVFLNGCDNDEQVEKFAAIGVAATLGTSSPVVDKVAREFSVYFYRYLATQGKTILEAYEQAHHSITTLWGENYRDTHTRTLNIGTHTTGGWPWLLKQTCAYDWRLAEAAHPCNRLPVLPSTTLEQLPEQPFKNLYYYTAKDAAIFFGRCQATLDVMTALDKAAFPLLLLHGGTGVGKSSFLLAGLIPRLQARQQAVTEVIRYTERITLGNLLTSVFGSADIATIRQRLIAGATPALPRIWLIDQLEEIFFQTNPTANSLELEINYPELLTKEEWQDNIPAALNLLLKTLQVLYPPEHADQWPHARIIFSIRTEWFGALHDACHRYHLASQDYLLQPLGKKDIVEIIEQPAHLPLLSEKYGLHIQEGLAEQIANDLLDDKTSSIAPLLQVTLSKLWQHVTSSGKPPAQQTWTQDLYNQQRVRNLDQHLEEQLTRINQEQNTTYGGWGKQAYTSGLLLDVLQAHTSPEGMAKSITHADYENWYSHIPYRHLVIDALGKCYLLIPLANQQTRLAHDTLALVVKSRYDASESPGQRARRILNSRKVDWITLNDKPKGTALDTYDLKLVEQGQQGTRNWQQDTLETAIVRKSRQQRRLRYVMLGSVISLLVLAMLGIVFYADRARQQSINATIQSLLSTSQTILTKQGDLFGHIDRGLLLTLQAARLDQTQQHTSTIYRTLSASLHDTTTGFFPFHNQDNYIVWLKNSAWVFHPDGRLVRWDKQNGNNQVQEYATLVKHHPRLHAFDSTTGLLVTLDKNTHTLAFWQTQLDKPWTKTVSVDQNISFIAISPVTTVVTYDEQVDTLRFWDKQGNALNPQPLAAEQRIHTRNFKFSPQGTLVTLDEFEDTLRFWNAQGQPLSPHPIPAEQDLVEPRSPAARDISDLYGKNARFSADGRLVTLDRNANSIRFWNDQGTPLTAIIPVAHTLSDAQFSQQGLLITKDEAQKIFVIWDKIGKLITKQAAGQALRLPPPDKLADSLPEEQELAATSLAWNTTRDGFEFNTKHAVAFNNAPIATAQNLSDKDSVQFSPAGFLVTHDKQTLRFWDKQGKPLTPAPVDTLQTDISVTFSPNGHVLTQDAENRTLRFWDSQGNALQVQPIPIIPIAQHNARWVHFLADGTLVGVDEEQGSLHFWSNTGQALSNKPIPTAQNINRVINGIRSVRFPLTGGVITLDAEQKTLQFWNNHGEPIHAKPIQLGDFNISLDDTILLSEGIVAILDQSDWENGKIHLWRAGEKLKVIDTHQQTSTIYSSPLNHILTLSTDSDYKPKLNIWSIDGKLLNQQFIPLEHNISRIEFSPLGNFITIDENGHTLVFWNKEGNLLNQTAISINQAFYDKFRRKAIVRFLNERLVIIFDLQNQKFRLFDALQAKPLQDLYLYHSDIIYPENSAFFLTHNVNTEATLWDKQTLQPIIDRFRLPDAIRAVSINEQQLAFLREDSSTNNFNPLTVADTTDKGSQLYVLNFADLIPEGLRKRACYIANRNLTAKEWKQYVGLLPYEKTCEEFPLPPDLAAEGLILAGTGLKGMWQQFVNLW